MPNHQVKLFLSLFLKLCWRNDNVSGKTHIQGGFLFGNALAFLCIGIINIPFISLFGRMTLFYYLIILAGSLIGSLMPDIDTLNSIISHKLKPLALIVSLLNWIFHGLVTILAIILNSKIVLSIFGRKRKFMTSQQVKSLQKMLGHRGLFHSLFVIIIQIIIYLPFSSNLNLIFGKYEYRLFIARFKLKQAFVFVPILSKTLCIILAYSANIHQNF